MAVPAAAQWRSKGRSIVSRTALPAGACAHMFVFRKAVHFSFLSVLFFAVSILCFFIPLLPPSSATRSFVYVGLLQTYLSPCVESTLGCTMTTAVPRTVPAEHRRGAQAQGLRRLHLLPRRRRLCAGGVRAISALRVVLPHLPPPATLLVLFFSFCLLRCLSLFLHPSFFSFTLSLTNSFLHTSAPNIAILLSLSSPPRVHHRAALRMRRAAVGCAGGCWTTT